MAFDLGASINDYGLGSYGDNAVALLALALRFDIDDVSLFANQALTDCKADKKCDVIYINDLAKTAVIAQAYNAQDPAKPNPPVNKAGDLNTAIAWALSMDIDSVPEEIRSQVQEVREGIFSGRIETLEFWYIHNLAESGEADTELKAVRESAKNSLHTRFPGVACDVVAIQVGVPTLTRWWNSLQTEVGIDAVMDVPAFGAFIEKGQKWETVIASVSASWLYDLFDAYGADLFKGNVRDYLGLRASDANINQGIRKTIEQEPGQFFVYNNGLSIITRKAELLEDGSVVRINGLSIVNGAQTTGSIGNAPAKPTDAAHLLARFISVTDKDLIRNVIQFNNSQNKVEAADFRSTDDTQIRLREEFAAQYASLRYDGGRRGGESDEIKRSRRTSQLLDSTEVAKSLAAFHGMPTIAYNRVKDLWNDENYQRIFPREQISARHIVFVYSLYRAIGEYKAKLRALSEDDRTQSQRDQLKLLNSTAAFFALMAGTGYSIEMFAKEAIASTYSLNFGKVESIVELVRLWEAPVSIAMPFLKKFSNSIQDGLNKDADLKSSMEDFRSSLEALGDGLDTRLVDFRANLVTR